VSFWETETSPTERRKLIATLFDRLWQTTGASSPSGPTPPSPATSRRPPRSPGARREGEVSL